MIHEERIVKSHAELDGSAFVIVPSSGAKVPSRLMPTYQGSESVPCQPERPTPFASVLVRAGLSLSDGTADEYGRWPFMLEEAALVSPRFDEKERRPKSCASAVRAKPEAKEPERMGLPVSADGEYGFWPFDALGSLIEE